MYANTYILIRTDLNLCKAPNRRNKQRWEYLRQCLKSVVLQNEENIHIVMLQSGKGCSATPKPISKLPKYLKELINDIEKGWNNISLYSTSCKGAGCAQYLIREIALRLAYDDDIFIQLDDDDYFTDNNAVKSIVEKFTDEVDICITGYKVVGDKSQDITNQAGSVHNQLLRDKHNQISLAYADSLGWTKSYRAKAIRDFHQKLNKAENDILAYFEKNRAFEDFMDIIALCRERSKIALLDRATHCYRKHPLSITAKTDKEQFEQRANALALSVQMAQSLDKDSQALVAKFCVVKILLIENILSKFRKEDRSRWISKTTNGYFFALFINTLKKSKATNGKSLLDYFAGIVESRPSTDDSTKFVTPEERIKEACEIEAELGKVDVSNCFITTSIKQKDARKQTYKNTLNGYLIIIALSVAAIAGFVIVTKKSIVPADTVSGICSLSIAIIMFCINKIFSVKNKIAEEDAKIEIYHEEIKELTRHLLANLNILKGLDESIERGEVESVGEIHFTNIKIPADSILLSNDPIQNSLCDDLNNIARLKVNIRNINNSADYLERLATKEKFDIKELHKAIQWEIVRYVGLLAQLRFFEENRNFKMPTIKQLKIYVDVRRIREYIASELAPKDKDKFDNIIKHISGRADYDYVNKYMERFYKDREEKRDLLTFE